jgi:hypothetical protein
MPHQREIVDVAFELDPDTGLLAYSEVVVIGPRQATGKTELLLPVMTHRCVGFDETLSRWSRERFGHDVPAPGVQRVLYTAQTTDKAREKWRDTHLPRLQRPYRGQFHARLQRNTEALIWRNGSMWSPGSTTGKTGGTGDTLDQAIIDEAWSRPDSRTELGMRPAMMTRPWRQMWIASMIPGLSRSQPGDWPYLKHKRQVGRARVEADVRHGMAFFDFGAPPGLDPADPQTWWLAMPGLGRTVTEKVIAEDFEAMDPVDFCAEYLGWEPTESVPRWTLVRREVWEALRDPGSVIVGPRAFAVEVAEDRSSACIVVAGRRADGRWHVEVVEPGHRIAPGASGIDWVLPRLLELVKDWRPCAIVLDPRRPAASLAVPLRNAGAEVLTPNQHEIAGACGRFFDATGETATPERPQSTWVHHLGQPELDRALAGARRLDVGAGSFVFVKKGSVDAIIPLYAAVLAMHGVDVKGSLTLARSRVW